MALTVGSFAPEFTLPDQDGKNHSLKEYRGKWILLYFYPEDDTPGCTMEACGIRDSWKEFGKFNAVVFGISADTVESHKQFVDKYGLQFTLLADPERDVISTYEAWNKKSLWGKIFMGITRKSFLINPESKITKIYGRVNAEKHASQVLEDLQKFAV